MASAVTVTVTGVVIVTPTNLVTDASIMFSVDNCVVILLVLDKVVSVRIAKSLSKSMSPPLVSLTVTAKLTASLISALIRVTELTVASTTELKLVTTVVSVPLVPYATEVNSASIGSISLSISLVGIALTSDTLSSMPPTPDVLVTSVSIVKADSKVIRKSPIRATALA